jgi:glucose/arabinose dehydrogenase
MDLKQPFLQKILKLPGKWQKAKSTFLLAELKVKFMHCRRIVLMKALVLNKIVIASGLNNSRGVALKNGDLYFSEVDKIWVIKNIEELLDENKDTELVKTLFNNDLPSESWHGGKWIMFGPDGQLYANVGAPCNVCLDGINKNPVYASIIKLNDENKWDTGCKRSKKFCWF